MRGAFLILLLSSLAPQPARGEAQLSASASLTPSIDTNPRRTVGEDSRTDELMAFTAGARGRVPAGDHLLSFRYEIGAKKFVHTTGEDLLVQQLELEHAVFVGAFEFGASILGKLRLSRDGSRDYFDGSGEAFADYAFSRALGARVAVGVRRFFYWPDPGYSSTGPTTTLSLRIAPGRRHGITAAFSGALPDYATLRFLDKNTFAGSRRRDTQLVAQLAYGYRGPVALQASYTFVTIDSNSFGENTQRHRVAGAASMRLPLGLFGVLQVAWQTLLYPQGIHLSSSDLLLLDEESQSSAALKLSWPATSFLDVDARYALYFVRLPADQNDPESVPTNYLRQTAGVGVTARW